MNLRDLRLLVVDDHAAQRQIVVRMLERLGVGSVTQAQHGQEALEQLGTSAVPFHAVLTDLDMPGVDGLGVARGVRARDPLVPVTLMSAISPRILDGIESLRGEGSDLIERVIRKPVSLDALRAWTAALCESRRTQGTRTSDRHFSLPVLAQAIQAGQIRPWFEPQIDLATGALAGFEALARWHHPELGVVSPQRFIPVLEGTPLMLDLSLSMLGQAAAAVSVLPASRGAVHAPRLSLNVGVSCFEDDGFSSRVSQVVEAQGLDPARLTLEITESASMHDAEAFVTTLARLRMRRFELAVDDFGTGFASLKQFTYGAYSEVKIDRSFVSRVADDRTAQAAVRSVATLAQELHLRCVAEGIESRELRDRVRAMGCSVGQGWLWSRPLPSDALADWVAAYDPAAC